MDGSLLAIGKSYSLCRLSRCRSGPLWALASHQQSMSHGGFTLVELLLVVVSLGVISAVDIPAYFTHTRSARINSSNQAAIVAAKACEAAPVTNETRNLSPGSGASGNCNDIS